MANHNGGPARRPSAAVYRRRRLVVGVLAILVIAALVAVISMLVGHFSKPQAADSPNPTNSQPSAAPKDTTPSVASSARPSCDQSKVTVKATTDAASYSAGKNPVFTLTVSNSGEAPCEVNVGTSQMEFLVLSGEDRIFSSKDCQDKPSDLKKTIAPGGSEKAVFPWPRNRTVAGCSAVAAKPGVGANAQYTLTVKLGDKTSGKAVFKLLS
ncbi:hypothetical protein [Psychromicrobium lacuslunae]|uniref:Membrane protein n=1 Tax=Psychromicrobium lacuslunae TaxID=1618207 RepID=A0A0D4C1T3_9MICC|nr:hypothetical protein [Psychromicrobium lacuslunae]AJT42375.1 membrane protein [Psychromicrobium lacuslunae]